MTGPGRNEDSWVCENCGTAYLMHYNAARCCRPEAVGEINYKQAAQRAIPARFVVDRNGVPDPETSRYVVLDIVHDWPAREGLRRLVTLYLMVGATTHAQELEQFLDETQAAARAVVDARNQQYAPKKTTRRR